MSKGSRQEKISIDFRIIMAIAFTLIFWASAFAGIRAGLKAYSPGNKVWLRFKISAINCKRLIKGLINRPIPELSTLLYNHLFSLFGFQRTYRVKFAA